MTTTAKRWTFTVLTWVVVVVLMVAGSKVVADALGMEWHGAARLVPVFIVAAVLSTFLSRRFRSARGA